MTGHHTLGSAAIAALLTMLGACTGDPGADARDEAASQPDQADSGLASPAPEVKPLSREVEVADLTAGRYALSLDEDWSYEIDVPAGWRVFDGTWLNTQTDELDGPIFFARVAPPNATTVPRHPCRNHTARLVGPTARDFVAAVDRLPMLRVGEPREVTVGGASGLAVDVRTARGLNPATCVDAMTTFYTSGADTLDWDDAYVGRWWIVDVEDTRVIFSTSCVPTECNGSMLRATDEMVESISFTSDE